MKQYVIDELRPEDYHKVRRYLDDHYGPVEMGAIYWVPLAEEVLSEIQQQHTDCQPFYVAIELQQDQLALELLVRTKNKMRCECMSYATEQQRNGIIELIDSILDKLGINI